MGRIHCKKDQEDQRVCCEIVSPSSISNITAQIRNGNNANTKLQEKSSQDLNTVERIIGKFVKLAMGDTDFPREEHNNWLSSAK